MMQAVAHGDVQSIAAAREIVSNSFEVREYTPRNSSVWNDSLVRFREIDS
jgi:hypothetical protein